LVDPDLHGIVGRREEMKKGREEISCEDMKWIELAQEWSCSGLS